MKSSLSLTSLGRTALAALALTFTVSCLPNSGPFAGGGPFNSQPAVTGSGGERTQVETTTRSRRPALAATSVFFGGGGGGGYRSGYHAAGYCRTCGYNPCRCSSRSHSGSSHYGHGHDDHSSHSSNRSSSSSSSSKHKNAHDTYRVAGGSLRSTQTKPSGYHSVDWYKSRGYDTSKMKLVNEHNQPKGHSSKSSSGSSKSSSGSSKSKSSSSGSSKSKSGSSSKSSSSNTKSSSSKRRK